MRIKRQGTSLSVLAPAKINLSLEVLGRRADGYHELSTVMVSVKLYDRLEFHRTDGPAEPTDHPIAGRIQLTINRVVGDHLRNETIPNDDSNLIVKAAQLLRQFTQSRHGVDILLTKKIPSQAGLGGGSSNAAATLVALNKLWEVNLPPKHLHELAAQLGSDVNFFLDSHTAALCTSRGELVEPLLTTMTLPIVIVKPPFGLSTAAVFQTLRTQSNTHASLESNSAPEPQQGSTHSGRVISALRQKNARLLADALHNDLQIPSTQVNPDVGIILAELARENVRGVGLTGSGSACFAICHTTAQARRVAARLRSKQLGQVFQVTTGT